MSPILTGVIASGISGQLNTWSPKGAYDALATVTVPSGGATTIQFAGIPTGYKHLQIRGIGRVNASNQIQGLTVRFNGDTSSSYSYHQIVSTGSGTPGAYGEGNLTDIFLERLTYSGSLTNNFGAFIIDVLDYTSNKNKTLRCLAGYDNNQASTYPGRVAFQSGLWRNTSAINTITLGNANTGGTFNFTEFSSFALYGVK